VTFEEIRNELRGQYPENLVAARAAFERDKAILRDEGVPIDQTVLGGDQAGQTGYRVMRSAYEIADFGLSDDEARALRLAVGTIRLGTSWSTEALWKVDLHGSADDSPSGIGVELPVDERLPVIHRAITEHKGLVFGYHGRSRHLQPWGLLARDGWWYLVGFEAAVGDQRTFRVDRIEGRVEIDSEVSFERPSDFSVRDAFPADPKLLPDNVDVGADVARVLVDATDAASVLAHYGPEALFEQRPDGAMVFDIPCVNVRAFLQWLFGFVERAEVLEPTILRDVVVQWLDDLAQVRS
jgi:predicted DNA-binding transcriptional regulator YafY